MKRWVWLGLVACSGGAEPDKTPASTGGETGTSPPTDTSTFESPAGLGFRAGSRLEPLGFSTPDDPTVHVLTAWWDPDQQRPCRFARHADGTIRCLPAGGPSFTSFFLDATCDTAGYQLVTECDPIDVVAVGGPRYGCRGSSASIRSVGPVALPAEVFSEGRTCESTEPPFDGPVYTDLGELPAATFVAAAEEVVDHPGPIDVLAYRADDGTLEAIGYTADGFGPCAPATASDGARRCLPAGTGVGLARGALLFADDKCTDELPFFYRVTLDCDLPDHIVGGTADGVRVYESQGRYEGTVYSTRLGGCQPFSTSDNEIPLIRGPEVPAADLPAMPEARVDLPGARAADLGLAAETSGGGVLRTTGFATADGPCTPHQLSTDPTRWICLPSPGLFDGGYADEDCTQPIGTVFAGQAVPAVFVQRAPQSFDCGPPDPVAVRAFETGAAYAGDRYRDDGKGCVPDPYAHTAAYALTEVPLTSFPEVREREGTR